MELYTAGGSVLGKVASDISKSDLVLYLESNKDIISELNYNEIDGLVFAQLSYGKFEHIYGGVRKKSNFNKGIYEYPVRMFVPYYADDILKYTDMTDDEKDFYTAVSKSKRYKNCIIHDLATADVRESQWAAFMTDIDKGVSVMAMRGTDGTVKGWLEDFALLYDSDGTNAQIYSKEYLENKFVHNIYLTGHSKGGNDCMSAYLMASENIRKSVRRINNYDGPGVNDDLKNAHTKAYSELETRLYNYYPKDSVIGLLLNDNPGINKYIDSEVRDTYIKWGVLGEHDPFSFKICKNKFCEKQQSAFSTLSNKILDAIVNVILN